MRSSWRNGLIASFGVVLLASCMLFGCGDDDGGSKPKVLTLADLEGNWEATAYKLTNPAIPLTIDIVQNGGSFDINAGNDGSFTGTGVIPGAMIGEPNDLTINFAGNMQLVTQDTLAVVFTPEIPPFITNFSGKFTLSGNTMTIVDENTTFDFDGDQVDDPAIFEGTMVRS